MLSFAASVVYRRAPSVRVRPLPPYPHPEAEHRTESGHAIELIAELHEDLDRLTRALVRKILHHPSTRLRGGGERGTIHLDVARDLFQLGEDDER